MCGIVNTIKNMDILKTNFRIPKEMGCEPQVQQALT